MRHSPSNARAGQPLEEGGEKSWSVQSDVGCVDWGRLGAQAVFDGYTHALAISIWYTAEVVEGNSSRVFKPPMKDCISWLMLVLRLPPWKKLNFWTHECHHDVKRPWLKLNEPRSPDASYTQSNMEAFESGISSWLCDPSLNISPQT